MVAGQRQSGSGMEPRAASLEAADGAYVTPELLVRAVRDISARRRTSSAADVTMYLQRRFPMRHADRRLLKEVERKLHIATQHGLFVHTGYSYRLPAEREGKALNSRDLSAFWTHYHRMERDYGSYSSTESSAEEDRDRGSERGRASEGPSTDPAAPSPAPRTPTPPPPPPPADRRRRARRRPADRARCRCSHCRGRSRSRSRSTMRDRGRGGGGCRRRAGALQRRRRRHRTRRARPAVAARRWRRARHRRKPWRRRRRAGALGKCVATTLHRHQQPPEAAGTSNSLLMYLVLQLPPESDDGTESC